VAEPASTSIVIPAINEVQSVGTLVERLRATSSGSLLSLVETLPSLILDAQGDQWLDVDTLEALEAFRENRPAQVKLGSSTSEVP